MSKAEDAAWAYNKKRKSGDDILITITEKTFVLLEKFRESVNGKDWCGALKKILTSHLTCNRRAKKLIGVKKNPNDDIEGQNLFIFIQYHFELLDAVFNMMNSEKEEDAARKHDNIYKNIREYLMIGDKSALLTAYLQLKYEHEMRDLIEQEARETSFGYN